MPSRADVLSKATADATGGGDLTMVAGNADKIPLALNTFVGYYTRVQQL